MQLDALVSFLQFGAPPVSAVAAAGATIPIGNVIDLLGNGVGQAPTAIIGNTTLWGADPGIGRVKPEIFANVGTAFATSDSCTAQFSLQYAADTGAAGGYLPGTWYDSSQTQAHAASVMTAGQVIRMDITPAPPEVPTPRFVQLVMKTPSGEVFTAGTITSAGVTMARDDNTSKNQAANYVVA